MDRKVFFIGAICLLPVLSTIADGAVSVPQMTDQQLMTAVQRRTFDYFWDFAHPVSGMAREGYLHDRDKCTSGGTGMGIMTIVVGAERGFVTRSEAATHILKLLTFLEDKAQRYHGAWAHWIHGGTGRTIPMASEKDNGGDIVETAFLVQGILTARQYFDGTDSLETEIRKRATRLWESVDWYWYLRRSDPGYENSETLYWHWSPDYGWAMNHEVKGFDECLILYVLAVASPTHPIAPSCYYNGWASDDYTNENIFYGYRQWVGQDYGGPLFFTHYSFLGLDPRYLSDGFCNYYRNNRNTSLINRAYCIDNPKQYAGYDADCWGLTASTNPNGYSAHSPTNDNGTITPTAAVSAIAYTPAESLSAMRHFYYDHGGKIWGKYGFIDAFNLSHDWYSKTWLAIDQGTIVPMIENYRTGLCWELFMSNPEIQPALDEIGFINDPYDNMLINPGFEDGATGPFSSISVPGWAKKGQSGSIHSYPNRTIGKNTLKLESSDTALYQEIAVEGGHNYLVGGYLTSFAEEPLTDRRALVEVEWINSSNSTIKTDIIGIYVCGSDVYDKWKYVERELAAPAGAAKCRVLLTLEDAGDTPGGTVHFDGFSIASVNERKK